MSRRKFALSLAVSLLVFASAFAQKPDASKQPGVPAGVTVERDLAYVPDGHERQKLDLYLPSEQKDASKPLPLIVWIHGGGWEAGSKDHPPAVRWVPDGYAVASINYRLSQHAIFPAQIEDCKAAIRWLRANAKKYHLDPDHIGVWGASAGGHLVALLGTTAECKEFDVGANLDQSSCVQCVCDFFGPTDFTHIGNGLDRPESPVSKLLGGTASEKKELATKASPVTYVDKHAAPCLIVHGDKDPLVPIAQSEELDAALKKAGAEVTFTVVANGGHGFGNKNEELAKPIKEFFDKHLKAAK